MLGERKIREITHHTLGAAPQPLWHAGEGRLQALEVVDEAARVTHEQLAGALTHRAVVLVHVLL